MKCFIDLLYSDSIVLIYVSIKKLFDMFIINFVDNRLFATEM